MMKCCLVDSVDGQLRLPDETKREIHFLARNSEFGIMADYTRAACADDHMR
jgi:hypothetical protein